MFIFCGVALVEQASDQHQAEEMNAEDPLFILYSNQFSQLSIFG